MSEVHRFHAAGHISAANIALDAVSRFLELPKVNAPDAVREKLSGVRADLTRLEQWFVDPLNTTIEHSAGAGGRISHG